MQNLKEYEHTYLALHTCIKARIPVILWGPPGQGKTSVIKALAAKDNRKLEVLLASIREPQDFAGLPSIHNGRATLVAPDWAQELAADGNGILFMDEVNTAPPAVQAALLRVSLDKVAGDCHLGENTSIVAAANPPEIAADGWDLAPPLANRFCHLDWSLPADVVRSGIAGLWPEFSVKDVTAEELSKALNVERATIGGFLMRRPELVTVMPTSTTEQGRAFPTPRSWETVAILSAWVTAANLPDEVRDLLIRGAVGRGASAEYRAYRSENDLPDPNEVLANPNALDLPSRPDQVFVIAAAVISLLRYEVTVERWHSAGEFLNRIAERNPDMAVSLARDWMATRPQKDEDGNAVVPDALLIQRLIPLMTEARLIA